MDAAYMERMREMSLVDEAREWLVDVFPIDDEDVIWEIAEPSIWRAIETNYAGGCIAFAKDGLEDIGPPDGLTLGLAIETTDGTYAITTRQDVRTLWHDVRGPDGTHFGSFDSLESAIEYVTGSYSNEDRDPTLGSCGCREYHLADCPTISWAE